MPGVKIHETMLTSLHFATDYNASALSIGKVATTLLLNVGSLPCQLKALTNSYTGGLNAKFFPC